MDGESAIMDIDVELTTFKFPIKRNMLADEPKDSNQFWVKDRIGINNFSDDQILNTLDGIGERLYG